MKRLFPIPLVFILSLPAAAWWTGTSGDQVISNDDNEYARGVQIIYGQEDVLHAFWAEDAPSVRELHYGSSADWGGTWTSTAVDRIISFQDGQDVYEECSVAVGLDGTLIVVWSEVHLGTREVHYGISSDGGATWSCSGADQILSDPASAVNTMVPSITCDLDGTFHVVWGQDNGTGAAEVHYARSSDSGATWSSTSADRVISFPDGNGAVDPKIMANNDHLIVIWRETGAGGLPHMHGGFSTDGGETWSCEMADHEISQAATLIANHDAAACIYGAGGAHVAYKASYGTSSPYYYEINVTSSYDGGETWTGESATTLASHDEGAGRSASNPAVFVSDDLPATIAWDEEDDLSGTKEQHISFLVGTGWTGAEADSVISHPDGENGYRPSIAGATWAVVPAGSRDMPLLWVAWTEFSGGASDNYEVHLSILISESGDVEPVSAKNRPLRAITTPGSGEVRLEFTVATAGAATLEIFDPAGRLIRTLGGKFGVGAACLRWDGRDAQGRAVQQGRYLARLRSSAGVHTLGFVRL